MEFVPFIAMLALVKKVIDFLKYVTNRDLNGVITTGLSWVGGVVVVLLFAASDFAEGIPVGDTTIAALNFASLVIIGMSIGASAGVAADVISSRRPTDDPARLKLVPNAAGPRGEAGHTDWQTALLATAVAVIVYLVMAKVFEIGVG